jgi:peptide chain release factor subunit 3
MADEVTLREVDGRIDDREHINIVFIGHVDAGKSTISGQVLLSAGKVDKRTIEKYEREAKDKNRESWYLAYIMDTSEDERARGKTVECGRADFCTDRKRITLLDAPGHKSYVPSMITGATQADIGCLVISARKGEFEAGFDKGGQTTEHMMLAKTLGINKLLVMVNKMDEPTVQWSEERYKDIKSKLTTGFAEYGYKKDDVTFFPASGLTGANIKDVVAPEVCPWYKGKAFFQILDEMEPLPRQEDKPVRMPITAKYKDRGCMQALGKLESGILRPGDDVILMPSKKTATVHTIQIEDCLVTEAPCGENLIVGLKGIEDEEVAIGSVICPASAPGYRSLIVEAQLMITDLTDNIPVLCAGYQCVAHVHAATSECTIVSLVSELNKKGKVKKEHPAYLNIGSIGIVRIEFTFPLAVEKFAEFPQLGRFTLRDKGKTIAIGKVMRLKPVA